MAWVTTANKWLNILLISKNITLDTEHTLLILSSNNFSIV